MSVAAISPFGGIVTIGISTRIGNMCGAGADAASQRLGTDGQSTRAAHAKGADPNESTDPSCHQRFDGGDGFVDCRCDSQRRTRCRRVGQTAGLSDQGGRGNRPQILGWQLAIRTSVYAETITAALSNLSTADCGL